MKVSLREWALSDAPALARLINNKKVQDNLRDGLPFPYGEEELACSILFPLEAWQASWRVLHYALIWPIHQSVLEPFRIAVHHLR